MDHVHVIRHKVMVEGRSQRSVADELGLSRNTVKKYLSQSEPRYRTRQPRGQPVLERVKPRLLELLSDWEGRTTEKQRITAARLHSQLQEEGFEVGATTVRKIFREWRRQRAETFVPLVHRPGDEAQVDFFEVTVEVNRTRRKCWMFLMRLMHGGGDFTWLYERCDQVAFLDGHVRAFDFFCGAPARCVYDNLSAAVRKILFPGRNLTDRFAALVSHYLIEPCFARPRTGHDKGGVESRGKHVRLQHLVPIPRGDSLDAINASLLKRLEDQQRRKGAEQQQRHQADRAALRALPEQPFEPRLAEVLTVSSKALVRHNGASYSVPSHWKCLEVMAYVGPTDIRFICRDEIQVRARVNPNQRNIQYTDYLPELRRKPQAVRQVAPELLAGLSEPFGELWKLLEQTHGGREAGRIFARVLGAVVDHGEAAVGAALSKAIAGGRSNLLELAELVRHPAPAEIEVPEPLRQYVVEAARAADYDHLLTGEVSP